MPEALLLNEAEVHSLLPMPELIATMEKALQEFSARHVVQPVRTVLEMGDRNFFALMPAYVPSTPAAGAKLVTVFHANAERGLPSHLATIVLLDPSTGALQAIIDGRYITESRTAAVSAVSVRKLARENAATLAILGSGVQARSHLAALGHVRNFRDVRVWSPTPSNLAAFAKNHGVSAAESAKEAVRDADVIVLATASSNPVIDDAWVAPGTHIVSVGACRPPQCEMDPALVKRARLFVDSREAAMQESGDVIAAGADHIAGEIGEPGVCRQSPEEITIFKSLGLAVEDVAAAHLVAGRARERGAGRRVSL